MDILGQSLQAPLTAQQTLTTSDYVKPDEEITDRGILAGRLLARPPPGEEIVISGISGRFPNSDDINVYKENLFNKVFMMDEDTRRWNHSHSEIPKLGGKINNVNKLDAGFFGIHQLHSTVTDPMIRILLETTYEAICDAGLTLEEMKGSRTGVFVGVSVSETEQIWIYENLIPKCNSITGCFRSMFAIKVSYFFQFQGPCYALDSACSSSFFALEHAYKAIRENKCDNAVVGGTNLCLHPFYTLQFARMGVLSKENGCRSFDENADGYTRSEAICSLLMQRARSAKRVLAKLVHAKVNGDGFKEFGLNHPSGDVQNTLLVETYQESNLPPNDVTFIEAHGTGTRAGDAEELKAISLVFCPDRPSTLYLGSVKSSIGHSEPASGMCSLFKVILGMEAEAIPPNIRFNTPRKDIPALEEGKIKVVTDSMPWPGNRAVVGINSFGFGGANAHVIVEWNKKTKTNSNIPDDNVPRLVCVSSRVQEGLHALLDEVRNKDYNVEFMRLIHDAFRHCVALHDQRGFAIRTKTGEVHREVAYCGRNVQHFYCLFGNVIENAASVVEELTQISTVAYTVENISNTLKEKKLKPPTNNKSIYDDIMSSITLQIVLVDLLRLVQLECKNVYGYSIGELTCAYYTESLTLEQTVISAHYVALAKSSPDNSMIVKELKDIITQSSRKSDKWVSCASSKVISAEFLVETINKAPSEQRNDKLKGCCLDVGFLDSVKLKVENIVKFHFKKNGCVIAILSGLGRLYNMGQNFIVSNLYPEITFPVTRGTPHISPLIKWNHKKNWFVTDFILNKQCYCIEDVDETWKVAGHVIDGRTIFPASGYLYMVWRTFATMSNQMLGDLKIVFENVKFLRTTAINSKGKTTFLIAIHKSTGLFEINEGDAAVATGRIYKAIEVVDDIVDLPKPPKNENDCLLKERDIYKELKIRGYHYKELFKGIEEYHSSTAKLKWQNNWVAFMDCMLQVKILEDDTRNLYVPTGIERLVLDVPGHRQYIERTSAESIEVFTYKDLNIIKSDHIEIRGLHVASIPRKKSAEPVLESHEFVANEGTYSISDAVRINVQIILENNPTLKFKAIELYKDATEKPLATYVDDVLSCEPVIQPDITIFSDSQVEDIEIKVEKKKVSSEKDLLLVMGYNLLQDGEDMASITTALANNGFVLTLESNPFTPHPDLTIITKYTVDNKLLILLRKLDKTASETATIFKLSNKTNWLHELQDAIAENPRLVVLAQNNPVSGILGFMNCLRREPNTKVVRCIFMMDKMESDGGDQLYATQLSKGLAINVFKDGTWGTYRHMLLKSDNVVCNHVCLSTLSFGDFSALKWIEGPLTECKQTTPDRTIVKVCCAALNFRDIMTASGRLATDIVSKVRIEQSGLQGIEFAGHDKYGKRVMGLMKIGAVSNLVEAHNHVLWNIPDEWSMEDAASVPIVYTTVLYALQTVGRMKAGSSILIHAGSGGVGLAAINVALYYGCKIFTTVGTPEKLEFLRRHYPHVKPQNFGNSRDTSFEQMILEETGGRGVDFVLNSLAEESFTASVRCLAPGGKFLEIGKFDLAANNPLHLELVRKQASFHGIFIDKLLEDGASELKSLLEQAITQGLVKPLPTNIFEKSKVEDAYRFMAAGKHIGKVVIRIREEAEIITFKALPRYYCEPTGVYIVLGGLGGFGLELSDWLVLRGATKIVLTSRSGLTTGYQKQRIRIWESYGVQTTVCQETCISKESCENLLRTAAKLGPIIGIFNLAVVLKDNSFGNMATEDFEVSFLPKYKATEYLDVLSRIYCPHLRDFVVFSSVSCGRGNIGQTNYGMSNSFMERICENRKKEGLPALGIQWGAVGDVGLVAELQKEQTEIAIGGTLQQRITSCLTVMDVFMRQEKPVVASMIIAQKTKEGSSSALDRVKQILGVRDIKTISLNATLPELGMDSIMGVEIKQTLERDYDIYLTSQDVRNLTFNKLMEFAESKGVTVETSKTQKNKQANKNFVARFPDLETSMKPVLELKTALITGQRTSNVVVLPGIEGDAYLFTKLVGSMKNRAVAYQYILLGNKEQSITDIAVKGLKMLNDLFDDKSFTIVAHSFGTCIALEMCALLEKRGLVGKVAILDGSPSMMYKQFQEFIGDNNSDKGLEDNLFIYLLSMIMTMKDTENLQKDSSNSLTFEERIASAIKNKPRILNLSDDHIINLASNILRKVKYVSTYEFTGASKLKSTWKLFRTKTDRVSGLSEDYGLSEYVDSTIEIKYYDGDHSSILDNKDLIDDVTIFVA